MTGGLSHAAPDFFLVYFWRFNSLLSSQFTITYNSSSSPAGGDSDAAKPRNSGGFAAIFYAGMTRREACCSALASCSAELPAVPGDKLDYPANNMCRAMTGWGDNGKSEGDESF